MLSVLALFATSTVVLTVATAVEAPPASMPPLHEARLVAITRVTAVVAFASVIMSGFLLPYALSTNASALTAGCCLMMACLGAYLFALNNPRVSEHARWAGRERERLRQFDRAIGQLSFRGKTPYDDGSVRRALPWRTMLTLIAVSVAVAAVWGWRTVDVPVAVLLVVVSIVLPLLVVTFTIMTGHNPPGSRRYRRLHWAWAITMGLLPPLVIYVVALGALVPYLTWLPDVYALVQLALMAVASPAVVCNKTWRLRMLRRQRERALSSLRRHEEMKDCGVRRRAQSTCSASLGST